MSEVSPGDVIDGKYRIVRLLGEGGMGAVYEGENVKIHRRVAIKTLHAAVAENADVVARFEREASAAGRIGNPHILEVLDLGQMPDGQRYMVMEFLDGEPLSKRIETRGLLSPHEVVPIALQVLEGLAAAHAAGIVHRDLKPDNVYVVKNHVGRADFVKIIDFGISKFQPLSGDGEGFTMTKTGAVMGTPYYMSPEQASGSREADARADLYAMGVILYQCVSGRVPYDATTFNQLLFKIVLSEPPPVKEYVPTLDDAFASIISKAMARDVGSRFQNAAEFAAALSDWKASGAPVSVPPPPDPRAMEAAALSQRSGKTTQRGQAPGRTAGSWSKSSTGAQPVAPQATSNRTVVTGLALAAVLLAAGGFTAHRIFSAPMTPPSGVPAAVAVPAPVPEPSPRAAPLPSPEATAKAAPSVAPAPSAAAVVAAEPAPGKAGPKGQKQVAKKPAASPKATAGGKPQSDDEVLGY